MTFTQELFQKTKFFHLKKGVPRGDREIRIMLNKESNLIMDGKPYFEVCDNVLEYRWKAQ